MSCRSRPALRSLSWLAAFLIFADTAAAQRQELEFDVDPRIELLAAAQLLSDYEERFNLITNFDFPYKEAMKAHFAPFADHEVVSLFEEMSRTGFSFDAPPYVMLHLSEPPELQLTTELPDALVERAGGRERLDRFIALIRDFAAVSDFQAFWRDQRPTIEAMVARAELAATGADWVHILESYYGMSQAGYHITLAPIFEGNYGPRVKRDAGTYELYGVLGTRAVEDGLPIFGDTDYVRHLALHEFGHSFVNPTTARFRDEVMGYSSLAEPIADRMGKMAYDQWETIVNEHILRAVTTRMVYDREGERTAERVLHNEVNRGFIYVPVLTARLEEYEVSRDRYPTFVDFYPQLLQVFAQLTEIDIVEEFGLDRFRGPINEVTAIDTTVVVVMPTNESDPEVQNRIQDYVRMVHERFYEGQPLVTDREALQRDLSEKAIVVYGTPAGNLWLAKHIATLPVKIEPDRIIADSVYGGDHLRLITAWPNPGDAARGVLIYTAQRAEDVPGMNSVVHGGTDWVIASGTEVLSDGFYEKGKDGWRF